MVNGYLRFKLAEVAVPQALSAKQYCATTFLTIKI